MKTLCLYFQIHQPFRLRSFPFFEIGNHTDYFDDYLNRSILKDESSNYYLPINRLLLQLIQKHNNELKISLCLSGTVLDQFEHYAPEVITSFKELYDTGCVEFVGETYAHSLAALKSRREFARQAAAHSEKIKQLFGVTPKTFRISQLIYTDAVGQILIDLGFEKVVLEGVDKVGNNEFLNKAYKSSINPDLKLLINNHQLSEAINLKFSDTDWEEYPITAQKFLDWIKEIPDNEQFVNLTFNYATIGRFQRGGWGFFEFLEKFIGTALFSGMKFSQPSRLEISPSDSTLLMSSTAFSAGNNTRKEMVCRLGNDMQQEAFYKLYELEDQITSSSDPNLQRDWLYLQSSDHFYYMCNRQISNEDKPPYLSPYDSPFHAYINYMNVLMDISERVNIEMKEQLITNSEITEEKEIENKSRKLIHY